MDNFLGELDQGIKEINKEIERSLKDLYQDDMETINQGALYATMPGGKRLRPVLLIKTFELFSREKKYLQDVVYPFAVAIELIHSYSLVHDDLPSMDNDEIRREKPSTHIAYGEGMAILIGDYLLNASYEEISKALIILKESYPDKISNGLRAFKIFSSLCGSNGMVGGQSIDIEKNLESYKSMESSEGEALLLKMISLKTGGLIKASILVGGILGGASQGEIKLLEQYSENLGLAFQITDDLLDYEEDLETKKPTYPTLLGEDLTKKKLEEVKEQTRKILDSMEELGLETNFLRAFSKMLINRVK